MKMTAGAPKAARVPTLTEVIEVADTAAAPAATDAQQEEAPWERTTRFAPAEMSAALRVEPAAVPATLPLLVQAAAPPVIDEDRLAERILADVQRQVGVMLEHRIRETLAPVLARLTDAVVQEARIELASALRDMVARAVAQEMARQRAR